MCHRPRRTKQEKTHRAFLHSIHTQIGTKTQEIPFTKVGSWTCKITGTEDKEEINYLKTQLTQQITRETRGLYTLDDHTHSIPSSPRQSNQTETQAKAGRGNDGNKI
jgi:hypothetical protein